MRDVIRRFIDPDVDRHLLVSEGEYVIDEVPKHWIVLVAPTFAMALAALLFISMVFAQRWWGIPFVMGLALATWGALRFHLDHMDRFVITNMRVFRVHGIFDQHLATMPMTRILDISVEQPFLGRLLGYGHFVFESAAQDQGLREIDYVGHPEQRDLTIQRVIQMAGLRTNLAHPK
ncbi:PH domain-containing protein [Cutibacterium sp.]|uniref:PH domain-containing protein n=1 Tax=Cutibacterium sp. TaxID=1912221 RepID=UPI0026DC64B5|nr:PH domain-containing protein [Cutibacterium sp.]MDO4411918.1 PH domain-containing protein [Cutibacterium sp.]